MAAGDTWDESNPTNNTLANEIDDNMRDMKSGVRGRMAHEHIWPSSQTGTNQAGFHNYLTVATQTSAPSLVYGTSTQMASIYASSGVGVVVANSAGAKVTMIGTANLGGAFVPSGGIIIWSGAISAIPAGWQICDGTNGTPDLTDRFVLHADADSGGTNDVGDTGGASTHTLTTDEMPAHTHTFAAGSSGSGVPNNVEAGQNLADNQTKTTSSTGGGDPHNNRDKYYALAYIMKL